MSPDIKFIDNSPQNGNELPRFSYVTEVNYPVAYYENGDLVAKGSDRVRLAKAAGLSSVGLIRLNEPLFKNRLVIADEGDSLVVFIKGEVVKHGPMHIAELTAKLIRSDYNLALDYAASIADQQAGFVRSEVNDTQETIEAKARLARQVLRLEPHCIEVFVDDVIQNFVNRV